MTESVHGEAASFDFATEPPVQPTHKSPPSELVIMGRLERQLEQLPDEHAKARVVHWLVSRYQGAKQ